MDTFIRVGNFKNIFWTDGSYEKPNRLPPLHLFFTKEDIQPILVTEKAGGTCVLEGDYNLAIYNGRYYTLKKLKTLDLDNKIYKYQLIYSFWLNWLNKQVRVQGELSATSNEKLVEKHLQSTNNLLLNPCKILHLNFNEITEGWRKTTKILFPEAIPDWWTLALSSEDFNHFKNSWETTDMKYIRNQEKWNFKNDLFIFNILRSRRTKSWKENIIRKLKAEWENIDFADRKITKVSTPANSFITGKYALTYTDGTAIGTTDENVKLFDVDLSNIQDIRPVNLTNKNNKYIPEKVLDPATSIFDIPISERDLHFNTFKLVREIYFPRSYYSEYTFNVDEPNYSSPKTFRASTIKPPQKITFKDNNQEDGYLWWVDRVDISLAPGTWKKYEASSILELGGGFDYGDEYFFNKIERKNLPSLGFLMFQLDKDISEWDLCKYTGETPKTQLNYYSGLNTNFVDRYSNNDYSLSSKTRINWNESISKLTLETDWFIWLCLAPSYKSGELFYNYQFYDNYDIWKYFNIEYNYYYYTAYMTKLDRVLNNKHEKNPFNKYDIVEHRIKKWHAIDEITHKTPIKLSVPLNKGEFFISEQEYKFKKTGLYDWMKDDQISPGLYTQLTSGRNITALSFSESAVGGYGGGGSYDVPAINPVNQMTVQDLFVNYNEVDSDYLNGKIILFSDENEIKIGTINKYTYYQKLTPDNEIKYVDGTDGKYINYFHITNIEKLDFGNWTENNTEKIIRLFYSSLGIAHKRDDNFTYEWFSDNDLKTTNTLFELVGTNWYVYIVNNRTHLISADGSEFKPIDEKLTNIDYSNIKTDEISLAEKVNQKCSLITYGKSFDLKTKFNFSPIDRFNVSVSSTIQSDKVSLVDKYFIQCNEKNDIIWEWIEVPKKTTAQTSVTDAIQLDLLKQQLQFSRERYEILKAQLEQSQNIKKQTLARKRESLYSEAGDIGINFVGQILQGAAMVYMPYWQPGDPLNSWRLDENDLHFTESAAIKEKIPRQTVVPKFGVPWRWGMAGANTLAAALRSLKKINVDLPMKHRWLDEDEITLAKTHHLENWQQDVKYHHEQELLLYKINTVASGYIKPEITERDSFELYKKRFNLNDIHLQVLLPTVEQLKELKNYYSKYGYPCTIPEGDVLIYDGMRPLICKFSYIESEGIFSHDNLEESERNLIIAKFVDGVRIIDYKYEVETMPLVLQQLPILQAIDQVNFNIPLQEFSREIWNFYIGQVDHDDILERIKTDNLNGLTEAEYELYKEQITAAKNKQDWEHLYTLVDSIISARDSQKTKVVPLVITPQTWSQEDISKFMEEFRTNAFTSIKKYNSLQENYDNLYKKYETENKQKNKLISGQEIKIASLGKTTFNLRRNLNRCNDEKAHLDSQLKEANKKINDTLNELTEIKGDTVVEKARNIKNALHNCNQQNLLYRETERKINEALLNLPGDTPEDKIKALVNTVNYINENKEKLERAFKVVEDIPNLDNLEHWHQLNIWEKGIWLLGKFVESKKQEAKHDAGTLEQCEALKTRLEDQVKLYGEQIKKKEELEGKLLIAQRREVEALKLMQPGYTRYQMEVFGQCLFEQYQKLIKDGFYKKWTDNNYEKFRLKFKWSQSYGGYYWSESDNIEKIFKDVFSELERSLSLHYSYIIAYKNCNYPNLPSAPKLPANLPNWETELTKAKEESGKDKANVLLADERLRQAGEKGHQLEERIKELEARECLFVPWDEYFIKYKDLSDEEWDAKFNIDNLWRLESKQFRDYFILLTYAYSMMHDPKSTNSQKQTGKALLRRVVERAIKNSKNYYFETGMNMPTYWNGFTQDNWEWIRFRQPALQQYIRDTYTANNYSSFDNFKRAWNNMNQVIQSYKMADFKNHEKLARAGMMCKLFMNEFMKINPKLEIWRDLNEGIQIIEVARGRAN